MNVDYFLKCLKYRLGGFNKFNKYEFDFYKLNTYENYFKDLQYSILYNPIITFYIENNEEDIKDYMKLKKLQKKIHIISLILFLIDLLYLICLKI